LYITIKEGGWALPNYKKHISREDLKSLEIYMKDIGRTPLLSDEGEIKLAKRIKKGDNKALAELTTANLRFVVSVAKQFVNQGVPLSDLISEGNLGLIKAAKRFDETRGYKFITYAVWWIRQAILQALAEQSRIVRLPLNRTGTLHKIGKVSSSMVQDLNREPSPAEIAEFMELTEKEVAETMKIASHHLSLDAPYGEGEGSTLMDILPDIQLEENNSPFDNPALKEELERVIDTLTPREAEVIKMYFGFYQPHPMTLEEIGAHFSLTRERIRQIKEKALRKLRHVNRSKVLKQFFS
jgi:RNA polymerase primary sigma factor